MAQTKTRSSSVKTATPAKSAPKKTPAKAAVSKPAAKESSPSKAPSTKKRDKQITAEQRYCMIAEAAYYIAEKRGFAPGDAGKDWSKAETQIQAMLDIGG